MIISGQPSEEYHAHPAVGSSTAKLATKSLQLVRDRLDGIAVVPDRGHFQIGRLIHMMRLEPERFASCIVSEGPINEKTGKPYGRDTQAFQSWQREHPELTVVEPWIHTLLGRCPDEVAAMFTGGDAEVSVYRDMPELGLSVKCRPDYLTGTLIADVKTCNDVDQAERDIVKHKYWFSDAWYRMVMKEETDRPHRFRFVFAEKKPPFRWRVIDLDADYSMWADDQVENVLGLLSDATRTGDWSDRGDLFQMVSRPDFMSDDTDEDEE